MKISNHFTKEEFEFSQYAARHPVIDNHMNVEQTQAAVRLCTEVLELIRDHYGRPLIITSGYRSPDVNIAVGGSPSSQHTKGEAADIRVDGVSILDLMDWIVEESGLIFDQCIYEFASWVHISFTDRYKNRQQVLTIDKDGTHAGIRVGR